MLTDTERHQRQHEYLEDAAAKAQRVYDVAYARAKRNRVRGLRRYAQQASRSARTVLYYGWRSHVQSGHEAKIGTFISLDELKTLHDKLHEQADLPNRQCPRQHDHEPHTWRSFDFGEARCEGRRN